MAWWATAANISTTIGVIVALGTLISGFYIFRKSAEYAYAAEFRTTLAGVLSNLDLLNELVDLEMANEVSTTIVYSKDLDVLFKDVHPAMALSDEDFEKGLAEAFAQMRITSAVSTPLTTMYAETARRIEPSMAKYQMDLPGSYRVARTVAFLFNRVHNTYKTWARHEPQWEEIFREIRKSTPSAEIDLERLKYLVVHMLTNNIMLAMRETQRDIDDFLGIMQIVGRAYMELTEREIAKQRRVERKIKLRSWTEIKTLPEELYEDQKAVAALLGGKNGEQNDRLLQYNRLVANFEGRRAKPDKASE